MGSKWWVEADIQEEAPNEVSKTIKKSQSQSSVSTNKKVQFYDEIKASHQRFINGDEKKTVYSFLSNFDNSAKFLGVKGNSVFVYETMGLK